MQRTYVYLATPILLLAACSSTNTSPKDPTAGAAASTSNGTLAGKTAGVVSVDDAIARACALPTPHFPFDSASMDASGGQLDALARCFATGPLKGRDLRLTGHADPRGPEEYNIGLGQRRAGKVEEYLEKHGVEKKHVSTLSRGALDAKGTDDATWVEDRRVDMSLAN